MVTGTWPKLRRLLITDIIQDIHAFKTYTRTTDPVQWKKSGMDSKSWHSHLKRKLNFVGIKTHSISLHPMPFILYISLSNLALFGLFSLKSQPTHCISLEPSSFPFLSSHYIGLSLNLPSSFFESLFQSMYSSKSMYNPLGGEVFWSFSFKKNHQYLR